MNNKYAFACIINAKVKHIKVYLIENTTCYGVFLKAIYAKARKHLIVIL